jgi:hypothetical protein
MEGQSREEYIGCLRRYGTNIGEIKHISFDLRLTDQFDFFREVLALPHPCMFNQMTRPSVDFFLPQEKQRVLEGRL